MNNRRLNMNLRAEYSSINRCFGCQGTEEIYQNCYTGAGINGRLCIWKESLNSSIEKYKRGKEVCGYDVGILKILLSKSDGTGVEEKNE